jgi:signal transduction histidine kinase/ligand-binding sensor domain-containing protein
MAGSYLKKRTARFLFAFWLTLFFFSSSPAQSILRFQNLTIEDGLSQSSVNYIFQDAHGFMWFATGDGLDRYDGKEFTVYKSRFNDTLSANPKDRNINSVIFEDRQGKLWMSTDAGISFFDPRHKKFKIVLGKYVQPNTAIMLVKNGDSIVAGVPQDGLYSINVNNLGYTRQPFSDKWQVNMVAVSNIFSGVYARGGMWIADKSGLLFHDRGGTDKRMFINDQLNGMTLLHDGRLLLCAADGVFVYDIATNSSRFISIKNNAAKEPLQWRSVAEDSNTHTVYLGAINSNIICKLNIGTTSQEFIKCSNSNINCLFIDRSQNLWVGTEGGGACKIDIKQPKFSCYTPVTEAGNERNGLMVNGIYRDDSGNIWMGSFNRGVVTYDPSSLNLKKVPIPFSTGEHISVILKDSSNNIVVTIENKIFWLDARSRKIVRQVRLPRLISSSPCDPTIFALIEWKKNHYLAGTNIGLYPVVYDHGTISACVPYSFRFTLTNTWTYNFYRAGDGSIYVGKRSGFAKIRMSQDSVMQVLDEGFEHRAIRHFYKSSMYHVLWLASEQGLIAYNETTKQYRVFDEGAGLANSHVYAILPQDDSTLWISTNSGIARVKVNYGNSKDIKVKFTCYTSQDGLQSNEFNTGSYFKCTDGTMIFGGIAGINWFRPDKITSNPYKPRIALAAIAINDSIYATDTAFYITSLDLPYNRNTLSFSLRALEYTNPDRNQFAYKLNGLDKDWVYTTNDKVRYAALPPGSYNFLVKASNNEGAWNDTPLNIHIVVHPPYWNTWWFRAALAMLVTLSVYWVGKYYIKQKIRAKTIELEKQQALNMERLRISKDVHDDLGSGLSKISLMAEIAQKRVNGNEMLGKDIKHISTMSKELVENMRDLIWVLNPENTTLDQLIARLREYCAEYLENMSLEVALDFPDNVPVKIISREVQRNIFLTVKEAINNSVKHADACMITVTAKLDTAAVTISVSDNGNGFDISLLKGRGNGLRNMRQRIELIGGCFDISSVHGRTTITLSVPYEKLSVEKIPL